MTARVRRDTRVQAIRSGSWCSSLLLQAEALPHCVEASVHVLLCAVRHGFRWEVCEEGFFDRVNNALDLVLNPLRAGVIRCPFDRFEPGPFEVKTGDAHAM